MGIEVPRWNLEEDIAASADFLKLAYAHAELLQTDGSPVPGSELCFAYLKVYKQTPHAQPGPPKSNDPARFVEITAMFPGEWYDFVEEPMITPQYSGFDTLWVYDEEYESCKVEEYLSHFYDEMYPQGYAIGLSPMGLFQVLHDSNTYGRCFQLDLEAPEKRFDEVATEMQTRMRPTTTQGFMTSSSHQGMHFFGFNYEIYTPPGKVNLASDMGSALLLNREGHSKTVDERSEGHQLRSLKEDWLPWKPDSEVGCLRVTRSLLKPNQPEFVSFMPIPTGR